jgi:hypothetical protein
MKKEIKRNLFKEGWQYITCYVTDDGKVCPMGEAKTKKYAIEIAKKHKHILCRLIKEGDYRKEKRRSND